MRLFAVLAAILGFAVPAAAQTAAPAYLLGDTIPPTLSVTDQNGKTHTFAEYRGKPVVLEWTNYECPFVQKHYNSGNMQKLQQTYTGKGVVWLSVISSAPGKQGYLNPAEAPGAVAKREFKGTAVLLDPQGTLGRAFNAQRTPHMYVLDANGKLSYMGAIDNIPSFNKEDVAKATNYTAAALDELLAGNAISTRQTEAYGCSIKY